MANRKRGEQASLAKLTEHDVRLLREINQERLALQRKLAPLSLAALADKFGVSKGTIKQVLAGETWTHVQ